MKKILRAKCNNMNVILLVLISLFIGYGVFGYFMNYSMGLVGLNLNFFTMFINPSMVASLGAFVFGLLAIITLWASINRWFIPLWCIIIFATCHLYYVFSSDQFFEMPLINGGLVAVCIVAIIYYLWCQKRCS